VDDVTGHMLRPSPEDSLYCCPLSHPAPQVAKRGRSGLVAPRAILLFVVLLALWPALARFTRAGIKSFVLASSAPGQSRPRPAPIDTHGEVRSASRRYE
jgi:hypothetical protein